MVKTHILEPLQAVRDGKKRGILKIETAALAAISLNDKRTSLFTPQVVSSLESSESLLFSSTACTRIATS